MKKLFFFKVALCVALLTTGVSTVASAQTRKVTGTVTEQSSNGQTPIIGASVSIKGQPGGTATDANGQYSIEATSKATLEFSYIGYKSVEVQVANRTKIDVMMETSAEVLEDLVVVGYGVQRRSDVAGSVTTIKAEELTTYPSTNVTEMLRGRAAGIQVSVSSGAPGSSSSIQVRGVRSLLDSSNTPLYVIDGVPATSTEFNTINSDDVASIEILKDAASQAIYGARAANGVIIITTKRGVKNKPVITFSSTVSSQHLWRNFDFYSPEEFYELRRQAVAHDMDINDPNIIAELTPTDVFSDDDMEKAYRDGKSTDWESLMFSPATMQKYDLGIRGGSDKIQVAASIGYLNQKGMSIIGSRYQRANVRVNTDYEAKKWLTLGVTTSFVKSSNLAASGSFSQHITRPPYGMPYDDEGNIRQYINSSGDQNPLYNAQYEKSLTDSDIARLNAYIDIHPLKGLSYKLNAGYYNRFAESGSYKQAQYTGGGAAGSISDSKQFKYLLENIVNYTVPFKDKEHSLNLTAVQSYEHEVSSSLGFGSNNVPVDQFWWHMIADGENTSQSHSISEYYLLSYLFRAQYSYKNRYIVNAAIRRDGSSRFGAQSKWGTFPSISTAWRISEEEWLKDVKSVSNLKLRVSYGMVGNQSGIGNYDTLGTTVDYKYEFGDNFMMGYLPGNTLPNTALAWESTTSANFGVDFGLFGNRLNGTIEYYSTTTNNLLFNRDINGVLGYTSTRDNVAQTKTTGWDISINGDVVRNKNVTWNLAVNYSIFDNKIVRLAGAVDEDGNPVDDVTNKWFIGQPINVYYDYKTDGIYQYDDFEGQDASGKWILPNAYDTDDDGIADAPLQRNDLVEPGKIKVVDKNGDGVISAADRYIIKRDPDFVVSLTSSLRIKNFDILMDWYAVSGVMKYNTYLSGSNEGGSLQGKLNGVKVNYWTPSNPSNEFPRPAFNSNTVYQSSLTLTDASYLRLRTLSVGYNVPARAIRSLGVQAVRISATATNLLTFTNYLSYSPETSLGSYPEAQQYAVSLNITF